MARWARAALPRLSTAPLYRASRDRTGGVATPLRCLTRGTREAFALIRPLDSSAAFRLSSDSPRPDDDCAAVCARRSPTRSSICLIGEALPPPPPSDLPPGTPLLPCHLPGLAHTPRFLLVWWYSGISGKTPNRVVSDRVCPHPHRPLHRCGFPRRFISGCTPISGCPAANTPSFSSPLLSRLGRPSAILGPADACPARARPVPSHSGGGLGG